jgi:hypothetical protein
MRLATSQVAAALDAIDESISSASSRYREYSYTDDEHARGGAEWYVGLAYTRLIVLAEALDLPLLRQELSAAFDTASKSGLLEAEVDPEGDSYLKHLSLARRISLALHSAFLTESSQTVTKDLDAILRATTYAITDVNAFGSPPEDEAAVHRRVEAVLRCVFPDLLHKPRLSKAVKNFEPDTGIPSIRTLIEFKFISAVSQVPIIAEQILADTRGYHSKDWSSFVYVIYETNRFKPESEWRQLLRECAVSPDTTAIVLTGERPRSTSMKTRRTPKRIAPPQKDA